MDVCRQELLDINKLDALGIFARQCLAGCRRDMDSGFSDNEVP